MQVGGRLHTQSVAAGYKCGVCVCGRKELKQSRCMPPYGRITKSEITSVVIFDPKYTIFLRLKMFCSTSQLTKATRGSRINIYSCKLKANQTTSPTAPWHELYSQGELTSSPSPCEPTALAFDYSLTSNENMY